MWSAGISGQTQTDPLFLAIVRADDGVLVPIAVHNGEWWGGWPFGLADEIDEVPLPTAPSSMPPEWLPPGLTLPSTWTLFHRGGLTQPLRTSAFTRSGVIMRMIGLTTDFEGKRAQWPDDEEAGIAVAGQAEIGRVIELDQTSADWASLWEEIRPRAHDAETIAIAEWEARAALEGRRDAHPMTAAGRSVIGPQDVHLAKAARPTDAGTWYHFVAHKRYKGDDCRPVTTLTGVAVRHPSGWLSIKSLVAHASDACISWPESTILGTLHWSGPLLWIARENLEDGFGYYLYDPESDSTLDVRSSLPQPEEEPTPAMTLPFVDEAAECGVVEVRTRLLNVIARRDVAAMRSLVAPDIWISQTEQGLEAFERIWRPEAYDSPLWSQLKDILELGGRCRSDGTFAAPYVAAFWPHGRVSYESLAVIARDVALRQQPSAQAPILATLSYSLVRPIPGPEPRGEWVAVDAGRGRRGYVARRYLRTRTPGAHFRRVGSEWRLEALIAWEGP